MKRISLFLVKTLFVGFVALSQETESSIYLQALTDYVDYHKSKNNDSEIFVDQRHWFGGQIDPIQTEELDGVTILENTQPTMKAAYQANQDELTHTNLRAAKVNGSQVIVPIVLSYGKRKRNTYTLTRKELYEMTYQFNCDAQKYELQEITISEPVDDEWRTLYFK